MTDKLTVEQVLSLAPDASSAKSGQELANQRKWTNLGCNGSALWGECQGSGKSPYQTQIDLSDTASKCSCPSRKFPCKHSLGLLLIYAKDPKALAQDAPPQWVIEWVEGRQKRAEQKAAKAEERAEREADPEAQAKRAANREAKVTVGLGELERWIGDLVRTGIASSQASSYAFWDGMAARMVDAQAPGIARLLRDMAGVPNSGEGWQERLLSRLSRLFLLVQGYQRIETLPPDVQAEIRSLIGWTQEQDDLLKQEGVRDLWLSVAQRTYEEDRLRVQKVWLLGCTTGKYALILSFSHMSQPVADVGLPPGACVDAELVYFAGSNPTRALIKDGKRMVPMPEVRTGYPGIDAALDQCAQIMAINPWMEQFPLLIRNLTPFYLNGAWYVRDNEGRSVRISSACRCCWELLAISGGHPIDIFGEWDSGSFNPMSVIAGGQFQLLVEGGNGE